MQKIQTLFLRDPANLKRVTREVDPDCKWVLEGEGVPTEKFDGSACLVLAGALYRRHVVKEGKAMPPGWLHWSRNLAQQSGHGWALVGDGTADQYHREAWNAYTAIFGDSDDQDGTYELVGPKVQGNPYRLDSHELWEHGCNKLLAGLCRDFESIEAFLRDAYPMEGIVWHHPDGRMAKIKRRDFGLPWPVKG